MHLSPKSFSNRFLLAGFAVFLFSAPLLAQTWLSSPGTNDWNTNTNWDTSTVPVGSATATFGTSSTSNVSLSSGITIDNVLFNGASFFSVSTNGNILGFIGTGVNNASGIGQTLINNGGTLYFQNSAQAVSVVLSNSAASSLWFQASSAAGSATINNSGSLVFIGTSSAAQAVINTLSGGSVSIIGSASGGTAQFTVASGGMFDITTSSAGAVTVGSIAGGGNFNLGSLNLLTGTNSLSTTVSGIIGGSGGSLTKTGLGTLTLTGANSYSGGTSITSGTLDLEGGSLGMGPVVNQATLIYGLSSSAVSTVLNTGTLDFNDTSSAGSASITNNAILDFNNSSSAVSASIDNSASMNFNNGSQAANAVVTNSGVINFNNGSSAANASIANTGLINFTGDSATTMASAGNAQITNDNFIAFNSFSTAGNSVINTSGSGGIGFTGNAQGGTAQFVVASGGSFDISGETGGVTVGSLASGGNVNLGANNLALGINNFSTTISGNISDSGTGSLTKLGTGTLTLTGSNSYAGGTTLSGGTLAVGNSSGLGTGLVLIQNGTLATSGGPLGVAIGGNYTQASGGTLQLGLGGSTVGQWDSLQITGSAGLAGSLSINSYSGFAPTLGESFEILTASSVSGYFSSSTSSITAFRFLPVYTSAAVSIVAIQPSFAKIGLTFNEKAVGGGLDSLFSDPTQEPLMLNLGVQSASALIGAYDQISPAGITPLFQIGFGLQESRSALVLQRLGTLWDLSDSEPQDSSAWTGQGPMFAANMDPGQELAISNSLAQPNRWGVYFLGLGDLGAITRDSNAPGYNFSSGGMAAGMDYRFSPDLVGGLLLGFSQAGTSQALDSVNVTGGQAGLYGGWKSGNLHLEALADGGLNNYTTIRASYGGTASGSTSGTQYGVQLGGGMDWNMDKVKIGPLLTGQYSHVQLAAFSETGSTTPLSFPNQGQDSLVSQLGFQASREWKGGGVSFEPSLGASWEHVFQGNLSQITAGLGKAGNSFTVEGPALGTDGFLVSAGLKAQLSDGLSLQAQYEGLLGMTNVSSQSFGGGIGFGF